MPTSLKGRSRAGSASSEYTHIPPEYIHRTNPSTSDFPSPAGPAYAVSKRDQGLVSPAQSSFSFAENDSTVHAISTPPSPALSVSAIANSRNATEEVLAGNFTDRGFPGDKPPNAVTRTLQNKELGRKRSQYYDEVFGARDTSLSPEEEVNRDSVITVEVKTNVIVRDEFFFLHEFSNHLSQRYQKPTSSIFITLEHSSCFLFAGSYESAYIVTITALPAQLLPTTNKRNTALIQSHLASSLGVLPSRGVIRFAAVSEEYLAISGTTYLGQIERLQKKRGDRPAEPAKTESTQNATITRQPSPDKPRPDPEAVRENRKSLHVQSAPPQTAIAQRQVKSTPASRIPSPTLKSPPLPTIPWDMNPSENVVENKPGPRVQKLSKRKSFFAFFGKA